MNFKDYSEVMESAKSCMEPSQAATMLQLYIEDIMEESDMPQDKAREIALSNIGYASGYYDSETKQRILRVFETEHPIFGKIDPTPEQAFNAGIRMGKAYDEGEDLDAVQTEIKKELEASNGSVRD